MSILTFQCRSDAPTPARVPPTVHLRVFADPKKLEVAVVIEALRQDAGQLPVPSGRDMISDVKA
jgi:hypothetical protein